MNTTATQQQIKSLVNYDPETGKFTWTVRPLSMFKSIASWKTYHSRFANKQAGYINVQGYRMIQVGKEKHQAHRVAWIYMTGKWPEQHIDHIDGQTANNRFSNLRECSVNQNAFNQRLRKNNKTGVVGVRYVTETSKWVVQIRIGGGRQIQFKPFNTKEEAIIARREAELKYHGQFASHLRPLRA